MYTKVGFIENFNPKGSYPEFGKPLTVNTPQRVAVEAPKPVSVKRLSNDKIIDKGRVRRAKQAFKATNPNHKDKVLAVWN